VVETVEAEGVDVVQQRVFTWWQDFVDRMQTDVALIIG
jgi:hypothetical protein